MDKQRIKQQIDSILSGVDEKQGILVVTDHNCPEGTYRHGELMLTAEELEHLRSKYATVVMFTSKKAGHA